MDLKWGKFNLKIYDKWTVEKRLLQTKYSIDSQITCFNNFKKKFRRSMMPTFMLSFKPNNKKKYLVKKEKI